MLEGLFQPMYLLAFVAILGFGIAFVVLRFLWKAGTRMDGIWPLAGTLESELPLIRDAAWKVG